MTTNIDTILELSPHYTNPYYNQKRTVFGAPEEGLSYDYSDRLSEWNYSKWKASYVAATATGATPGTARHIQARLSYYYDKPLVLRHVVSGVNRGDGYPYNVFGYKVDGDTTE